LFQIYLLVINTSATVVIYDFSQITVYHKVKRRHGEHTNKPRLITIQKAKKEKQEKIPEDVPQ
jgi:hypothetical protein